MERTPFTVPTETGELSGWVAGVGPPVLAIHGGPGMSYDYLDDAVTELAGRYQVATFQQRGLAPSTLQGTFTVAEAVADIAAVLDGLGWDTAYLVGHSWGGHLVFHAAIAIPERFAGVLSVDPLGAVGDGGAEAFGAEMLARVPEADRERARLLDEKVTAGKATPEEEFEAFSLVWASYFADPPAAPHMPQVQFSQPAAQGLGVDLTVRLPELEASLPSITVPFGVIVGQLSPMPPSAGTESAERHPWRVVACRARSGTLRLARSTRLHRGSDGSARCGVERGGINCLSASTCGGQPHDVPLLVDQLTEGWPLSGGDVELGGAGRAC